MSPICSHVTLKGMMESDTASPTSIPPSPIPNTVSERLRSRDIIHIMSVSSSWIMVRTSHVPTWKGWSPKLTGLYFISSIKKSTAQNPRNSMLPVIPSLYNTSRNARYTSADPVSFWHIISSMGTRNTAQALSRSAGYDRLKSNRSTNLASASAVANLANSAG